MREWTMTTWLEPVARRCACARSTTQGTITLNVTVSSNSFAELGLSSRLLRALEDANYKTPTPIQTKTIPLLLDGRDLLGIAQTGTGKTAAFALPLLHHLEENDQRPGPRRVRALILAPTRELAVQISDSIKTYGRYMRVTQAVVMGGVGQRPQVNALQRGVDVLVATPGRLIDLINQGHVDLSKTEYLTLDEADRMLDMGFIRDVRKIISKLSDQRQTLLFSATMPTEVAKLAREILFEPERVEIFSKTVAVDRIDQRVHHLEPGAKRVRLVELLSTPEFERVIVFTRTKHGADKVVKFLERDGVVAEAIHGNKSQGARQRALNNFRNGRSRVLVATDIASRGIDVDDVTHVINYELPNVPESYVHRIGRTARAGAAGIAISFCDASERPHLRSIERLIKRSLNVVGEVPAEIDALPLKKKAGKSAAHRPGLGAGKRRNRSRHNGTQRAA
jgi:ATP-dependent RNA helicase RhlE